MNIRYATNTTNMQAWAGQAQHHLTKLAEKIRSLGFA